MSLRRHLYLFAILLSAATAQAQVRPPADTTKVRPDTTKRPAPDTSKTQVFADSIRPADELAQFYQPPARGLSDGVFAWDRKQFLDEGALVLGDLLERLPGFISLRSGLYLQPEAATAMGGTGNRIEVWLDGYVLDPMLESSFDMTKLELANIETVRIDRRMGTTRVFLTTLGAHDSRPYSEIEAAVGQPRANLFRGVFAAPHFLFGPAAFTLDRIDTNGNGGVEPADQSAGWATWGFVHKGSGVQVEYRRVQTDRDPQVPWREKWVRDDLMLRARLKLGPVLAEAFGGKSSVDVDTTAKGVDKDSIPHLEAKNTQVGGRVGFTSRFFWGNAAFRTRDAQALAKSQLDGEAGINVKLLSASAHVTQTDWRAAGTASELTLRAQATPIPSITVFGESTTSDRGVAYLRRQRDSTAVITSNKGYRAGADLRFRWIQVGAAYLHVENDSVTTFGLPFDTTAESFGGNSANGVEVSGRLPLPLLKGFAVEGNLTNWHSGTFNLYMPTRLYRVGLEYNAVPLKSGNLAVIGRIEMIHRGGMFAPDFSTKEAGDVLTMPALDYIDAYLMIRIMSVRAYMRLEDLQQQRVNEIPNRELHGARLFYGIKWEFFN